VSMGRVKCSACKVNVEVPPRRRGQRRGLRGVTCSCNAVICADCGLTWTTIHDCQVAQELLELRDQIIQSLDFEDLQKELGEQIILRRCPKCRQAGEKDDPDSCDHITCVCGHEFCWSCLADRKVIEAHGNHFHNVDCRFYCPWDDYKPEYISTCPVCKRTGKPCSPPKPESKDIFDFKYLDILIPHREHSRKVSNGQQRATASACYPSPVDGNVMGRCL